jgi:hypothetical protein
MKKGTTISEIFERKAAARRKLAQLPIEEKMEIARRLNQAGKLAPGYLRPQERTEKFVTSLRAITNKKTHR